MSVLRGRTIAHPAPAGLPGLITAIASRMPDAEACRDAGGSWTYRQLEEQAAAVAGVLAGRPDTDAPVVVCIERRRELVAALLGVLKAGRAYLPVTEDQPPARLRQLLRISGAHTALGSAGTHEQLVEAGLDVVCVEDLDACHDHPGSLAEVPPRRPVYVQFTSGSTGEPKGVELGSAALCNRLSWMREHFGVGPGDRIMQKTPITFDVSGWEVWLPLISGACCVLLPPGEHVEPERLDAALRESAISLVHFVPSMLREFLTWPRARTYPDLRAVVCSGEALPVALVREFARSFPDVELHNLYGPTEAAIDVTSWRVPTDADELDQVSIGGPIDNCSLAVLDEDRRPVPPGIPGELYIGGVPLALGYINRPELTEAAFVPAPTELADLGLLYRTGDRVRADGDVLYYLGRIDDQCKVHGQRVEPSEVAAALERLAPVEQAAVLPFGEPSDVALAAFVTGPAPTEEHELRRAVADLVPTAWVPERIYWLDRLPMTGSGKIDRSQLAERLEPGDGERPDPSAKPALERIWQEVLGRPWQGHFLDGGGHSMAAARLSARLAREAGRVVGARWLITANPTLAELTEQFRTAPPLPMKHQPTTDEGRVPAAPNQRRLWLLSRMYPADPRYNVVHSVLVSAPLDVAALRRAVSTVVGAHSLLRSGFTEDESGLWLQPRDVRTEVLLHDDPSLDAEEQADAWVARLADEVFAPDGAALFAVHAVRFGDGRFLLVVVFHHAISDQGSAALFLRQVGAAYSDSAAIPPQGDFARYARIALTRERERADSDLAWWRQYLFEAPLSARLPFAKDVERNRSAVLGTSLPQAISADLRALARREGVTTAGVVLTALAVVLSRWLPTPDVVIGVASAADRQLPSALDEIGFFVDTIPLRVDLRDGPGLLEALRRTAQNLAEATQHNAIAFDRLAREIHPDREFGDDALFQVWFNDVSQEPKLNDFGGHTATEGARGAHQALFDLGLYLDEIEPEIRLSVAYDADRYDEPFARAIAEQTVAVLRRLAADSTEPVTAFGTGERRRQPRPRPQPAVANWPEPSGPSAQALQRLRAELGQESGPLAILARRHPLLGAAVVAAWQSEVPLLVLDAGLPSAWQHDTLDQVGIRRVLELLPGGDFLVTPRETGEQSGGFGHALVTSGTTGHPQVVRLPTGAAEEPLRWLADTLGLDSRDRFCFLAGAGHDPMLRQVVLPFLLGATCVQPDQRVRADLVALLDLLVAESITVLDVTPAQAALLVSAAQHRNIQLPALRWITLYGATLRDPLAIALARIAPTARIANLYGATETPQASSLRLWKASELRGQTWRKGRDSVPVGAGTPYRQLTVLTSVGEVAGIGQIGEIAVRGNGLALDLPRTSDGYLRSGDLGRYTPDGEIDVLGRADRQLSVRGYRVEATAVETLAHGQDGVALAVAGLDAENAFVLWLTTEGDLDQDALWRRLRTRLPAWSLPDRMQTVPAIPLTGNGKADLAVLAALKPGTAPSDRPGPVIRNGTALTDLVSGTFREVLDHAVPAEETFFQAGLTSLDLVRVHSVLESRLDRRFPVIEMFRRPRLPDLVAWLDDGDTRSGTTERASSDVTGRLVRNERELRRAARRRLSRTGEEQRNAR